MSNWRRRSSSGRSPLSKKSHSYPFSQQRKSSQRREENSILRVKTLFQSLTFRGLQREQGEFKKVCFTFLEVREYPMTLGDNPSCIAGPPITIEWGFDPSTRFVLDIDTFEKLRGIRRRGAELLIPRHVRENRLINFGHDKREIVEAIRKVRRDKHARIVSHQQSGMDVMQESLETVSNGLKRMFVFRKSEYEKTIEKVSRISKNTYPFFKADRTKPALTLPIRKSAPSA